MLPRLFLAWTVEFVVFMYDKQVCCPSFAEKIQITMFSFSQPTKKARLAGKPIVSLAWMAACSLSGRFVPVLDHLLVDTAAEKRFNFRLSSAFQAAQRGLLLSGVKVWMTPGRVFGQFKDTPLPSFILTFCIV